MAAVRGKGLGLIGWGPAAQALRQRASYAGLAALSTSALADSLELWLEPVLSGCRGLRDIGDRKLTDALTGLLDWPARPCHEHNATAYYPTHVGTRHSLAYGPQSAPPG